MPVNQAEVAFMRGIQRDHMRETAVIMRLTETSDGIGGLYNTWRIVASVPCRRGKAQTLEHSRYDMIVDDTKTTMVLSYGADVKITDRLEVSGNSYDITEIDAGGEWATTVTVNCKKVA